MTNEYIPHEINGKIVTNEVAEEVIPEPSYELTNKEKAEYMRRQREQLEINDDRTKLDSKVVDGGKTNTSFDDIFDTQIKSSNLVKDGSITQYKTRIYIDSIISARQLGPLGKLCAERQLARLVGILNVGGAGGGWTWETIKHYISKSSKEINMVNKTPLESNKRELF